MRLSLLSLNSTHGNAAAFRLITIALVALSYVLSGDTFDSRLLAIGFGYVVLSASLLLLMSRLGTDWLVFPSVVLDVALVTGIISLPSATASAIWILYVFPIASSVLYGRVPTSVALCLSVLGYLAGSWFAAGSLLLLNLWPVAVLAASTFLLTIVANRWMVERREKRVWREIAAAARAINRSQEPDEVTASIVEQARRLVRGECSWIWWCNSNGDLQIGPKAGQVPEQVLSLKSLTPALMRKLDDGNLSLAELGELFAGLRGEVVVLRRDQAPMALLAVGWPTSHCDYGARREQLQVFSAWASERLAQVQAYAASREELQRESSLASAAAELSGTVDRQMVERIAADATRSGLKASVSLVERPSGRVLHGDVEVTEALVRLSLDSEFPEAGTEKQVSLSQEPHAPLVVRIAENRALIAWRPHQRFDDSDITWLNRLAVTTHKALLKCAEYEQLQNEERKLRAALDDVPAPLVIWSADREIVFVNSSYRALGLDSMSEKELGLADVREEEVIIGDPARVFTVSTSPVGEGEYLVSHYREITREREALRAKDELIAMVGHELRTPLSSIHGYSQMMARHLSIVEQQVGQINRLIGDFVDASRIGGGNLRLNRQAVNLSELARQAAERLMGAYEGRKLRLRLEDVPSVEGDPARLEQVLDNLLSNAAKYSPVDQEIVLTVANGEDSVLVSVQDHGIGVEAEHLPRLFDRFYRVPCSGTERVKGTGLGLSIVRDLVVAHGGRVWAESPGAGQGSTFWVSLPAISSENVPRRLKDRQAS